MQCKKQKNNAISRYKDTQLFSNSDSSYGYFFRDAIFLVVWITFLSLQTKYHLAVLLLVRLKTMETNVLYRSSCHISLPDVGSAARSVFCIFMALPINA